MKLSSLTPDTRNANKGTARGRKLVRESLKRYGAGRSILLDKHGAIIAGNKTAEAAGAVGMEDVQIVKSDGSRLVAVQRTDLDINDKAARELAIADNRASEIGLEWDVDILKQFEHEEVDLSPFWDERELVSFFARPGGEAPEPKLDQAEALRQKWETKRGQIWEIGKHRLMCGDSTSEDEIARVCGSVRAEMVFTDPPYNVDYEGNYIQSGKILAKTEKVWAGGIENDNRIDFAAWLHGCYAAFDPLLADGCAIYIWHPSGAEGRHFWAGWLWESWHFQVDLVWNKTSLIISRWDYKPQHEPCMYGWKGKNRQWVGPNNVATVWDIPRQQGNSGEERNHPTQKPVSLAVLAIKNHGPQSILDPFAGSGSTLCAAQIEHRTCYALEIEPKYVAVALERLSDMGLKPVLQHA